MASEQEVKEFLREFHDKMNIWDILFRDDRGKNLQTIADLEIRPIDRKKVIESLHTPDYCEGPTDDKLWGGSSMWVFGKEVKRQEVYIKITMGRPTNPVICISFHTAEFPMQYPFK